MTFSISPKSRAASWSWRWRSFRRWRLCAMWRRCCARRLRPEGPQPRLRAGRGPAGRRRGRLTAPPSGAAQPGRQRHQVHRSRPRGVGPLAGGQGGRPRAAALFGPRHGYRHGRRRPGPALRKVHPGRQFHHPPLWRHRTGPGDLPAARAQDGRGHQRAKRAGRGRGVFLRAAPAAGRRPGGAAERARARFAGEIPRPGAGWSRTTPSTNG